MRHRSIIISICVISVILFCLLVYYGLRHSRGVPVIFEEKEKAVLEAVFIDRDIDLTKKNSLDIWNTITPKEIELQHQTMFLPWSKTLITPVSVKAFYNKRFIYFYIRWNDETENRIIDMNKFSDAAAIMFPLDKTQPAALMIGPPGKANTNIWQWKAAQDREYWLKEVTEKEAYADFYYPFEEKELFVVSKDVPESAVNDLAARRVGTKIPCFCPTEAGVDPDHAVEIDHGRAVATGETVTSEEKRLSGRGFWGKGYWDVIFKRSFEPVGSEYSAVFNVGEKRLCSFIVWDGAKGDRATRRSISDWVELEIKYEKPVR